MWLVCCGACWAPRLLQANARSEPPAHTTSLCVHCIVCSQVRSAQKFLSKGAKVKLTMTFSGREMRFKDQGKEMMLVRFE